MKDIFVTLVCIAIGIVLVGMFIPGILKNGWDYEFEHVIFPVLLLTAVFGGLNCLLMLWVVKKEKEDNKR